MRLAECGESVVCGEGDVFGSTFITDGSDLQKLEITNVGFITNENILLGVE